MNLNTMLSFSGFLFIFAMTLSQQRPTQIESPRHIEFTALQAHQLQEIVAQETNGNIYTAFMTILLRERQEAIANYKAEHEMFQTAHRTTQQLQQQLTALQNQAMGLLYLGALSNAVYHGWQTEHPQQTYALLLRNWLITTSISALLYHNSQKLYLHAGIGLAIQLSGVLAGFYGKKYFQQYLHHTIHTAPKSGPA